MFKKLFALVLAAVVCTGLTTTSLAAQADKKAGSQEPVQTPGTTICYSIFSMDTFTYDGGYKLQPRFCVGLEYSEGSLSPNRIVSVSDPVIYIDEKEGYIFAGEIFCAIISGNELYYDFNGNIYETGNVQWTVDTTSQADGEVTKIGTTADGDGYVTNVSESGTYYSAVLKA